MSQTASQPSTDPAADGVPPHRYTPALAQEDVAAFYEQLRNTDVEVKTSQPSVGDFTEVYRPLLEQGLSIVSVHLSAALSGTCESARQASDQPGCHYI